MAPMQVQDVLEQVVPIAPARLALKLPASPAQVVAEGRGLAAQVTASAGSFCSRDVTPSFQYSRRSD
jgi:hypothetical protein